MRSTTTTSVRTRLQVHLPECNLSAAGLGYGSVKLLVEQATSQAAAQFVHDLGRLCDLLPVGRSHVLDLLVSELATLLSLFQSLSTGPVGTLIALVLPVGGPLWSGVIPVGTTVKVVRGVGRLLARIAIPATGNASASAVGQAGRVTMTVLIVDDSLPFLEVARRLLTRGGLEVVGIASTGAEALAQAEALRPQVALIDLHLAGESGFDVARRLAGCCQGRSPAVVLMSTHSEADFSDLIAASPAAGFVHKERLSGDAIRTAVACSGR